MADTGYDQIVMQAFGSETAGPFARFPVMSEQADQQAGTEFMVFGDVGGELVKFSELARPDMSNARVQLDIYCAHPARRRQLLDWIIGKVAVHPQMEQLTSVAYGFDRNISLYSARFDVSVWWKH